MGSDSIHTEKSLLYQLIYSSRTTHTLTNPDLSSIVSIAQRKNLEVNITGALCYAQGTFLQCIEGEHSIIHELYQHLHKDERHEQLKTLDIRKISKRRFPNWTLGFFSYENEIGQLFLQHAKMAEFVPFSMDVVACNAFVDEVVKYVKLPKKKVAELVSVSSSQFMPSVATRMYSSIWVQRIATAKASFTDTSGWREPVSNTAVIGCIWTATRKLHPWLGAGPQTVAMQALNLELAEQRPFCRHGPNSCHVCWSSSNHSARHTLFKGKVTILSIRKSTNMPINNTK